MLNTFEDILIISRNCRDFQTLDFLKRNSLWFTKRPLSYSSEDDQLLIFCPSKISSSDQILPCNGKLPKGQIKGYMLVLCDKNHAKVEELSFRNQTIAKICLESFRRYILKGLSSQSSQTEKTEGIFLYWNKDLINETLAGLLQQVDLFNTPSQFLHDFSKNNSSSGFSSQAFQPFGSSHQLPFGSSQISGVKPPVHQQVQPSPPPFQPFGNPLQQQPSNPSFQQPFGTPPSFSKQIPPSTQAFGNPLFSTFSSSSTQPQQPFGQANQSFQQNSSAPKPFTWNNAKTKKR